MSPSPDNNSLSFTPYGANLDQRLVPVLLLAVLGSDRTIASEQEDHVLLENKAQNDILGVLHKYRKSITIHASGIHPAWDR